MADENVDRLHPGRGLSPEILDLIVEQVYELHQKSLPTLRLVSRVFNSVVIPWRYRNTVLSEWRLGLLDNLHARSVLSQIYRHTRHFEINAEANLAKVVRMIENCERLEELSWSSAASLQFYFTPLDLLNLIKSRGLRFNFQCYNSFGKRIRTEDALTKSFPAAGLRSLVISKHLTPFISSALTNLLVQCQNLDSLTINGATWQPSLPMVDRLPPIRKLVLVDSEWPFTSDQVERIWDFSQLQHLEVAGPQRAGFLATLPYKKLKGLVHLKVSNDRPKEDRALLSNNGSSAANSYLEALLTHCENLETLEAACLIESLNVTPILRNRNLRILKLSDVNESLKIPKLSSANWDIGLVTPEQLDKKSFPMLSQFNLGRIRNACPSIATLNLAYDKESSQCSSFLATIAEFEYLRSLTLRTDSFRTNKAVQIDLDLESAKHTVWQLKGQNASERLSHITLEVFDQGHLNSRRYTRDQPISAALIIEIATFGGREASHTNKVMNLTEHQLGSCGQDARCGYCVPVTIFGGDREFRWTESGGLTSFIEVPTSR